MGQTYIRAWEIFRWFYNTIFLYLYQNLEFVEFYAFVDKPCSVLQIETQTEEEATVYLKLTMKQSNLLNKTAIEKNFYWPKINILIHQIINTVLQLGFFFIPLRSVGIFTDNFFINAFVYILLHISIPLSLVNGWKTVVQVTELKLKIW